MATATTTKEFVIVIENKPGTLGEITSALGKASINITGFQLQSQVDFGVLRLTTADPGKTESWLKGTRYAYRVRDVVTVPAKNRPGEIGRLAQTLAASGINIEAAYHTFPSDSDARVAFAVDDVPGALKVLG